MPYSKILRTCGRMQNAKTNCRPSRQNGGILFMMYARKTKGTAVHNCHQRQICKGIAFLLIFAAAVLCFCGCADKPDSAATPAPGTNQIPATEGPSAQTTYPYTFQDTAGNTVVVKQQPQKIVTVGPNLTEIVYALGKGSLMAGRTDYDNYPEEVAGVASIGELSQPNVEAIVALEPDIVLVSGTVMPDSVESMKNFGLPVVVINDQASFDGVYDTIALVGRILNASEQAEAVVRGMREQVAAVADQAAEAEKVSVYYVVGYGEYGDYTATGDTFIGKMLEMAGGDNIAKNSEGWYFSKEALIEADPYIIICSNLYNTKEGFCSAEGYKELTAVKEGRVFEINTDPLDRQGPRLAEGLAVLADILHGDRNAQ